MTNPPNYHWLDDNDYSKLRGQTQMTVSNILGGMFKGYGQEQERKIALKMIMDVIETTWKRVRGKDKPIVTPDWLNKFDIYNADD